MPFSNVASQLEKTIVPSVCWAQTLCFKQDAVNFVFFSLIGEGSLRLVEVASVLGTEAKSEFVYAQGESNFTVWPGKKK